MDPVRIYVPGTPSRPERPSAIPLETSIDLNWDEPWNGGAYIDYYNVAISNEEHGSFVPVEHGSCAGNIPPMLRSCTVTNLTPGTQYYFAIVAHNRVGYSEPTVYAATTALAVVVVPSPTPEETPTPEPMVSEQPTPTTTVRSAPIATAAPLPTQTVVPMQASESISIASGAPTVSIFTEPAMLVQGQQVAGQQVADLFGLRIPQGAKVTFRVAKISKNVCKVSKGKLVALGRSGSCFATMTVTTAKSKKYKKKLTTKKSFTYLVK
jgi:hypothetical protein